MARPFAFRKLESKRPAEEQELFRVLAEQELNRVSGGYLSTHPDPGDDDHYTCRYNGSDGPDNDDFYKH